MAAPAYLRSAEDDLNAIAMDIARRSGSGAVASRFAARLRRRCRRLADLGGTLGTGRPDLGTALRSVSEGGYLIVFRYREDRLEIVRVLHGGRDLGDAMRAR